jgi:hypothetical protein
VKRRLVGGGLVLRKKVEAEWSGWEDGIKVVIGGR